MSDCFRKQDLIQSSVLIYGKEQESGEKVFRTMQKEFTFLRGFDRRNTTLF